MRPDPGQYVDGFGERGKGVGRELASIADPACWRPTRKAPRQLDNRTFNSAKPHNAHSLGDILYCSSGQVSTGNLGAIDRLVAIPGEQEIGWTSH